MCTEYSSKRYQFFICDLIEHKKYVLEACKLMSFELNKLGRENDAVELLKRGFSHDNSKLNDDELESFMQLKIKDKCFTNANSMMNDYEKEHIALHWKNNSHHPEHFENIYDMSEIDILEMVCDWAARSMQYKTNLVEFVKTRQINRFKFPQDIYEKVLGYCEILQKYIS